MKKRAGLVPRRDDVLKVRNDRTLLILDEKIENFCPRPGLNLHQVIDEHLQPVMWVSIKNVARKLADDVDVVGRKVLEVIDHLHVASQRRVLLVEVISHQG